MPTRRLILTVTVAITGISASPLLAADEGESEGRVLSFAPAPATGAAEGTAGDESTQAPPAAKGGERAEELSFNFDNAPWSDVLKLFADAAGLTLNIRDLPPGAFTYYDDQRYTPTEALDLMNRYLLQEGYILVRHDQFLTVFNVENSIPPNLIETVEPEELPRRGGTELVRVVLPVGDRGASRTAEEIRDLLGPQGSVIPLDSAGSVVVTDLVDNLIRVQSLLAPPPQAAPGDLTFRSFPLRHVHAAEVADTVRELFGQQKGIQNVADAREQARAAQQRNVRGDRGRNDRGRNDRGNFNRFDPRELLRQALAGDGRGAGVALAASGKAATIAVNERTNSVLVTATAADMKIVEQVVQAIDVAPDERGMAFQAVRLEAGPRLEAYVVRHGDTDRVAETIKALHPGTVVNHDDRSDRIHVWATPEKHRQIAAQIRQLDGGTEESLTLIPLNGISAHSAMETLRSLWEADAADAPAVRTDAAGRNLVVRGRPAQVLQIQSLVRQMEEAAAGDSYAEGGSRIVPGADPSAAPAIEQMLLEMFPQIVIEEGGAAAQAARQPDVTPRRDRMARSAVRSNDQRSANRGRPLQRSRSGGFRSRESRGR